MLGWLDNKNYYNNHHWFAYTESSSPYFFFLFMLNIFSNICFVFISSGMNHIISLILQLN